MKSFIIKSVAHYFFIIFALFAITTSSCKKDKTCYGTVKVIDTGGASVSGADILLSAPSVGGTVTYTGITDANGEAHFEIKLPAIFDVKATAASQPGKTGLGTLRCDEPGKKTSTTVKMI